MGALLEKTLCLANVVKAVRDALVGDRESQSEVPGRNGRYQSASSLSSSFYDAAVPNFIRRAENTVCRQAPTLTRNRPTAENRRSTASIPDDRTAHLSSLAAHQDIAL